MLNRRKHNLVRAFIDGLINRNDEHAASFEKHALFMTKWQKFDTSFMTKTAAQLHPLEPHIPM